MEAGLVVVVAALPLDAMVGVSVLRLVDGFFARFTAGRGSARRTAARDDAAFVLLPAFAVSAADVFLLDLVSFRVAIEQITCSV
jgi:hypothetical protein